MRILETIFDIKNKIQTENHERRKEVFFKLDDN